MEKEKKKWENWEDLPEDAEKRMLENMASFFVDKNLGLVAQMVLESGEPVTSIFSTLGIGLFGPFLDFFGVDKYFAFFRKKGNAMSLLTRIEELEDEQVDSIEAEPEEPEPEETE